MGSNFTFFKYFSCTYKSSNHIWNFFLYFSRIKSIIFPITLNRALDLTWAYIWGRVSCPSNRVTWMVFQPFCQKSKSRGKITPFMLFFMLYFHFAFQPFRRKEVFLSPVTCSSLSLCPSLENENHNNVFLFFCSTRRRIRNFSYAIMSSLKRKKSDSDEQVEMRKAQKQAWVQSMIRQ